MKLWAKDKGGCALGAGCPLTMLNWRQAGQCNHPELEAQTASQYRARPLLFLEHCKDAQMPHALLDWI
jgi:hypothetical protein